jgi:hypothetical protein
MSDEYLTARAEQYETKADELEDKINNNKMTLRERAEYDQHVPFSLQEHDTHIKKIHTLYETHRSVKRELEMMDDRKKEDIGEEGLTYLKKKAEVPAWLEAEYKKLAEKN